MIVELRRRQFVFLHQEWPVMAATEHDGAEMPEVPGEDRRVSSLGHRHDCQIRQIGAGVRETSCEFKSKDKFGLGWSIVLVDTVEERSSEVDGCGRVAPAP